METKHHSSPVRVSRPDHRDPVGAGGTRVRTVPHPSPPSRIYTSHDGSPLRVPRLHHPPTTPPVTENIEYFGE